MPGGPSGVCGSAGGDRAHGAACLTRPRAPPAAAGRDQTRLVRRHHRLGPVAQATSGLRRSWRSWPSRVS
ncbi:hypothetical protein ADK64_40675 [Streptomyces sp. MMG1121]|nr:hypothetical protein ADK64_40675 [Streptomyces sp. MMG1121]